MSLYGPEGSESQPSKSGFKCGRTIPGHTVGRPDLHTVQCQQRHFEITVGQAGGDKLTPITTHCVTCRAQDPLRLLMTNAGGERGVFLAQSVPALIHQGAAPNLLVCQQCCQFRFELIDEGNEIKRRCVACKDVKHLGYESASNSQQQRSFTMGN